ncbi:hypothetical protein BKA24_001032 [Microbacterium marinum]|uniref:M23ase beta-sheet core domain-containing protein n=1 Tax=Microbacterium marinum TaxID=421115 RepID=A0A7W7FIP7_9MICO|nr:FG-GAP-like repeat-containing protein [Microbacterium marinum]MBB4666323.1 hypothetical protein [Microbacterium marinum]
MRLSVPAYGPQPVFRLPYAPGLRWGASGSHADSDGIHRGAVDFAPLSSSDKRVLTVAAGMVYRVRCGDGWFLGVDHGGGWMSEYYHLTSARSSLVGTWVEAGTRLGYAGQTLPCGGTPGAHPHVHLSILNSAVDVPSGKRKYVAVNGVQFDNYTLEDASGAYDGAWRNLAGTKVLTSRGVTCCLRASSRVGPDPTWSPLLDTDGNGVDDYSEATAHDTDLNSDGLPDIVAFGGSGVYTSQGSGRAFTAARLASGSFGGSSWTRSTPRHSIDVNNDGRPDAVGFGSAGVHVAIGSSQGYGTTRLWTTHYRSGSSWRVGVEQRVLADVTGDRRPDIVAFGGAGVYVSRNTGSSFAAPEQWSTAMGTSAAAGGWVESRHPRHVLDMDGDGRADLVGFRNQGVYVARNTGSGFADPVRWSTGFGFDNGWKREPTPRHLVDVTGDGRPDVVGFGSSGVWVARNTGSTFAASVRWTTSFRSGSDAWRGDRHPRTLADVNGDGRLDIVGFGTGGTVVSLNRGTSFAPAARWTTSFSSTEWTTAWMPRAVVDVNGDGRADVVGFARDGVQVALSSGSRFGAPTHAGTAYGWEKGWRVQGHQRSIAL